MRESIGGSMLFYIVLFFLSIFIFFIASVIRYARVYKIKNSLVTFIERNEGFLEKSEIDGELTKMGYQENGRYKICRYYTSQRGGYYYVELYASFGIPLAENYLSVDVSIKGSTYMITTGTKIKSREGSFFNESGDECKICDYGSTGTCVKTSVE